MINVHSLDKRIRMWVLMKDKYILDAVLLIESDYKIYGFL